MTKISFELKRSRAIFLDHRNTYLLPISGHKMPFKKVRVLLSGTVFGSQKMNDYEYLIALFGPKYSNN